MTARYKLLVVDDDEAMIDYLHAKLGERYDIVSTNAPENVLALARKAQPSLILCDVDMPGMDGGDVSAALFADDETRDIPVLFLSALVSAEQQVGERLAVAKSAPVAELMARIESLLKA